MGGNRQVPYRRKHCWSKDRFGNFVLELEFKLEPETNSGGFFHMSSVDSWQHRLEVQLLDASPHENPTKIDCGAICGMLAPGRLSAKPAGEWNRLVLIYRASEIMINLNDEAVNGMDMDDRTEPSKNPDGTKNSYPQAVKNMSKIGHIPLQHHGDLVQFQKMRIAELSRK